MCFVLYIGTEQSLPLKKWIQEDPDICVESLTEHDLCIKKHFTKPIVQYVGSTSGCGCDFPYLSLQNGEWPNYEDENEDLEWDEKILYNRKSLYTLLKSSNEKEIEAYGVWDGDYLEIPKYRETIDIEQILHQDFFFKEQGFYKILKE